MIKKLNALFIKIVDTIEENPLPLKRYLFLFLAILSIRLCLEFFSNQRLFRLEDVLHIGLWFVFIVTAFMLQLHLFSGEKVDKIIRLVVCCFSIALTAPLIDLIVSQGKMSKMNYLSINSYSDILKSYVTIGGASLSRGATLGIRIEIVLLVIASFNYVYTKTKSLLKACLGTFSIYTVLFLSGAIPFFIGKLNAALNLKYGTNDQSSIYLLFTLDLFICLLLVFRMKRKVFTFKISLFTILRLLIAVGLIGFGAWLARINYPTNWTLDPTTIYYFPLVGLLAIILSLYDTMGRRNLFQKDRYTLQNGVFFLLLIISLCVSFHTCFATLIVWALLFILFEKPLNFIRIPFLSSFFEGLVSVGFLFIGFLSFGAPLIGFPTQIILLVLFASFSVNLLLYYSKIKNT